MPPLLWVRRACHRSMQIFYFNIFSAIACTLAARNEHLCVPMFTRQRKFAYGDSSRSDWVFWSATFHTQTSAPPSSVSVPRTFIYEEVLFIGKLECWLMGGNFHEIKPFRRALWCAETKMIFDHHNERTSFFIPPTVIVKDTDLHESKCRAAHSLRILFVDRFIVGGGKWSSWICVCVRACATCIRDKTVQ